MTMLRPFCLTVSERGFFTSDSDICLMTTSSYAICFTFPAVILDVSLTLDICRLQMSNFKFRASKE